MNKQDLNILAQSMGKMVDALAEQKRLVDENRVAGQELSNAVADLRVSLITYQKTLNKIDVSRLNRKARRLVKIMEAAEQGIEPLRLVKAA